MAMELDGAWVFAPAALLLDTNLIYEMLAT
jgi:hypothetical protein